MERSAIGKTGIQVPRLCVGCWQAAGWSSSDDQRFMDTLRHALDGGLTFLDTAEGYGNGHSEDLVGRVIADRRDGLVLATKVSPNASRPKDLRAHLERSLTRLRTDYVDLYQQHWPPKNIPLADTIGELERLKEQGKIRAVGVSNWMEPEWEEIDDPGRIDCLQPNYSLLWRVIEKNVLPLCRTHEIGIITYSSLCQGILAGRFKRREDIPQDMRSHNYRLAPERFDDTLEVVSAVEEVARKYGKTPAQTALRWILDQEGVTAAIVGASRPQQVDENLGALDWTLDAEDREKLSRISAPLSENLGPRDTLWGWHPRA